jgi:hypothetical protein
MSRFGFYEEDQSMKYIVIVVILAIVVGAAIQYFQNDSESLKTEQSSGWMQR